MKFSSFPWWSKLSEIETTQAVTDDISQTFLQTLDHVVATPASVEVPDLWAAQLFSKWMLFFLVDKGEKSRIQMGSIYSKKTWCDSKSKYTLRELCFCFGGVTTNSKMEMWLFRILLKHNELTDYSYKGHKKATSPKVLTHMHTIYTALWGS